MNLIQSNIKTMTSSQLGELLGYEKKEVNKKINSMFLSEIAGGKISRTLRENGQVIEYYLPEVESQMFAAKWNIQHLRKVVEFFVSAPAQPQIPQNFAQALQLAADQAKQLEIAAPKVEYHDKVLSSTNGLRTTEIASELGMSAIQLNRLLKELKVQRKIGGRWVLTASMLGKGLTTEGTFVDDSGNSRHSMLWTETGRKLIHELIGSE